MADMPALAAILYQTTLENEWGQLRFGSIDASTWLNMLNQGLRNDRPNQTGSECMIMVAIVDETATIAGFAQLHRPKEDSPEPIGSTEDAGDTVGSAVPQRPEGYNIVPIREYYRQMIQVRERSLCGAKFYHLVDLAVRQECRRQGIATILMKWAMGYVDANQGFMYFEATPEGLDLYEKLGFQTLEKFGLDLRRYGGKTYYEEVAMRWPVV